jgi:hypothetical protein
MARERPKLSAKRWAETADSGFTPTVVKLPEGVNFFSPKKAGTYRLEIVPYEVPANPKGGQNPNAQPGELHYERTYFSHRGIGADERSYVCPAQTCGRPCPICEHRRELMRDRDADEDLIKALAPKQRQLWNIYDHAEPEKGVQVWDVSFHLFGRQLKAAINNADEDDGWEYFADPADGLTLRIGMEEKSFAGNSFLECATVGFKSRREPLSDEILDAAQPLDDLLILLDYDKLKSIFLQEEGVDHGDDDEPAPKKERKQSKPADDDDEPAQKKQPKPPKEEKPKAEEKPVTAADLGIGKGDDCRYAGKNWTIIRVSEDGLTVTLSNDDDEVRKGIKVADLQPPAGQDDVAPKKDEDEKPSKSKQDDSDDWDADFDDEPKKGKGEKPKADKVKTGPKKEDAKKPAKDDSDDWDDF